MLETGCRLRGRRPRSHARENMAGVGGSPHPLGSQSPEKPLTWQQRRQNQAWRGLSGHDRGGEARPEGLSLQWAQRVRLGGIAPVRWLASHTPASTVSGWIAPKVLGTRLGNRARTAGNSGSSPASLWERSGSPHLPPPLPWGLSPGYHTQSLTGPWDTMVRKSPCSGRDWTNATCGRGPGVGGNCRRFPRRPRAWVHHALAWVPGGSLPQGRDGDAGCGGDGAVP